MAKITLTVSGMHCASCANSVQKTIEKLPNTHHIYVNFATNEVAFETEEEHFDLAPVVKNIEKLGYVVSNTPEQDTVHQNYIKLRNRFLLCLGFTLPLFIFSMVMMFSETHLMYQGWIELGLALPVMLIGWAYFGKSAFKSLRSGVPNMDVLITLSSSTAFLYSVIGLIQGNHHFYFETAATIITLVLLGNVFEHNALEKTQTALKALQKLQVPKAQLIQIDLMGNEMLREVEVSELQLDDLVLVKAGDNVPVDGIVVSGTIEVNEAMFTGESVPVPKNTQQLVIGGTMVIEGSAKIQVQQLGKDSVLQQLIDLVKQAQHSKPNLQKIGDKVSAVFVPIVALLALSTFFINYYGLQVSANESLLRSIAVLAVSCPCAMGLATPTAIMVGLGRATLKGVLFKSGESVEKLAKAKYCLLDKTGTLTTGEFSFSHWKVIDTQYSLSQIEQWFLSLQQHSNHPIARSLVQELTKKQVSPISLTQLATHTGKGVSAQFGELQLAVGNRSFYEAQPMENVTLEIVLFVNQKPVASVLAEDTLKPDADKTIQQFQHYGITCVMISGDKKARCEPIANLLGIKYHSEVTPEKKFALLKEYQQKGIVMMVGDGINDAPALAQADIGIAIGSGTQVATATATVILKSESLQSLAYSYRIAVKMVRTIKQNLFWAFFYNSLTLPLAMLGALNPMLGALIMALSDVVVIGNSLLLKTKKI